MDEMIPENPIAKKEIQAVADDIAYFTKNILPKLSGNFRIHTNFTLDQLFGAEYTDFTWDDLLTIKYGISQTPSAFSWDDYQKINRKEPVIKQQKTSDLIEHHTDSTTKILAQRELESFQRIKQLSGKPSFTRKKEIHDILDCDSNLGIIFARKILNMISDCLDDIDFLRKEASLDSLILSKNKAINLDKLEKILCELGNTISTLSKKPQNQQIMANGMRKGLRNLLQDFYGTNSIELFDLP